MRCLSFRKKTNRKRRIVNVPKQAQTVSAERGFNFTEEQWRTIRHWQRAHKCRFRMPDGSQYFGCAGGGYDYCFTPTGLGMLAEVRCVCGAKIDMDDI